ncbi:MAG: alpha/beta fold hydrolase [Gemmatimonadales bacterium]|nr:alpha/beta fold hydrolase [Gemmatimonadales bacterium]
MRRAVAWGAAIAALAAAAPAPAQEADAILRDVRFASGERLDSVRLHYRTLGRLRRDGTGTATNAVLILHGTGGSHQQFLGAGFAGVLFGPGQPLDTARFFVVLPDNVGHGASSKPSDGLRARFPRYAYGDMVALQERLLREALGVTRLRLVLGTSMGCMHAWTWLVTRPDAVEAAMPLACQPAPITGRNRMVRRMAMDAILLDPAYRGGEYAVQPPGLRHALDLLFLMGSAPLVQQRQAPTRDQADSAIHAWLGARLRTSDANDFVYHFDSSRDYDPWPALERVQARVTFVNSADDFLNPPEIGTAREGCARVPTCRFVLLPAGPETRGHGTHTLAALWQDELRRLLATLPSR